MTIFLHDRIDYKYVTDTWPTWEKEEEDTHREDKIDYACLTTDSLSTFYSVQIFSNK